MVETFENFLAQEGYHLGFSPKDVRNKMKEIFSTPSLQRFESLLQKNRPYTHEELYSVVDNLAEASLLFSPQASSRAGQTLYEILQQLSCAEMQIADMGCGVGSWMRWVASIDPHRDIVGFDRHAKLLEIAKRSGPGTYQRVEYENLSTLHGAFDILCSLLGIDFTPPPTLFEKISGVEFPDTAMTRYFTQTFASVFSSWKRVLKPGGVLLTAFSLPSFEAWYSALLGASKAGFALNEELSSISTLSIMVFQVQKTTPDLDRMLRWWIGRQNIDSQAQVLFDAAALLRYRSLEKRVVDHTLVQYEDGHLLQKEIGYTKDFGYVYEYATTLYRRLECIPIERLKEGQLSQMFISSRE